jgi:hypothetical protein
VYRDRDDGSRVLHKNYEMSQSYDGLSPRGSNRYAEATYRKRQTNFQYSNPEIYDYRQPVSKNSSPARNRQSLVAPRCQSKSPGR